MCGLAGFVGVKDQALRESLIVGLGSGIESRGRDACGFVSINDKDIVSYSRAIGPWTKMKNRFIRTAASGSVAMLHSRLSTCHNGSEYKAAHPFAIKRDNKTILWGAHNGIISNAFKLGLDANKKYDVDSQAVLDMLPEWDVDKLGSVHGYGVLTWIENADHSVINVMKITKGGDLVIAKTPEGLIYASTWPILRTALEFAEIKCEGVWENQIDAGVAYVISKDGLFISNRPKIDFNHFDYSSSSSHHKKTSYHDWHRGADRPSVNDNDVEDSGHLFKYGITN